jgi:hypothetical protein
MQQNFRGEAFQFRHGLRSILIARVEENTDAEQLEIARMKARVCTGSGAESW